MNATTTRIRRHHRRTKRTTINVDNSDNGSAKNHQSLLVEGVGEKHNDKDGAAGKEDKNGNSKRRRFILRRKQLLAKKVA